MGEYITGNNLLIASGRNGKPSASYIPSAVLWPIEGIAWECPSRIRRMEAWPERCSMYFGCVPPANRIVEHDTIDTTLTPPGTQYGAT